ncbi:carboxylating nicotinate-nucleotide diphosphorylase [Deinococcus deserti]|uniref:Probable nicotinate-nucleotide pyrophosphorylase [carboxylating] n=1 Tax=Deinococcus deserti (strain DSM 17065 / CIP 109153 / LMG 22923 / VCD115) TaxID=546414 RepID=C1CVS9_DEIDV|nr:carboxylating nicotinate-nucleotide diphosphorylase [Deinococcus deserti]ACO46296.1 putative Nicotinate-nucleotide diphosphorylase, carboxylating (Nicotinate-nucleotide pyrophosphorylase, carboxylating)(Quinolinate phosphoribosyltransferase, decarboxylating) [Deinococcus deserti VCD115]
MLSLDDRLRAALAEDIGRGDATTLATIPASQTARAEVLMKESGVLSGLDVAARVFTLMDPRLTVRWSAVDGEQRERGPIGVIEGPARSLLSAERLALNLLQRLSGVATQTRRHVDALGSGHTQLLDTRKTTPLWRDLEKQAVRHGGGLNHRAGLDDGILIKDNHVAAAGGVTEAICRARTHAYLLKVECEVSDLAGLREALRAGADRVLLDNMNDDLLAEAVAVRNELAPHVTLEASGNMTLERLPKVATSGVDYVSVGALTHSAPALDISLNFLSSRTETQA